MSIVAADSAEPLHRKKRLAAARRTLLTCGMLPRCFRNTRSTAPDSFVPAARRALRPLRFARL